MKQRLQRITGGAPAGPLLVLFGLNFVDEFDRIAFAWLTPEIRDAFSLTDAQIGAIGVVAGGLVLLAALPLGYLADRLPRVRLALGAAVLWGTMSALTGLVPAVALLFVVRLLSGIGRAANEIVHPSLLTDWYDQRALPRVFQVHRLANPLSAIGGIAAGAIAAASDWRVAFVVLSVPTFVLLAAAARLREPDRGESLDAGLAADYRTADPIPFREARRQLFAVRSLRRIWLASLFNGAAIIATPQLVALFFEDVYGFGPFQRGVVSFLYGAGIVTGLLVGGALAQRAVEADRKHRLALITGFSGVWVAGGMVVLALAPWGVVSAAAVFLFALGAGSFQPGYYPLVGLISPPRVRSQAYAWAILFLTVGAFSSVLLFSLGDTSGYRTAMVVLAVSVGIAGLISASAHRFVQGDVDRAEASLAAAREGAAAAGDDVLLRCRGVEVAYGQVQVLFGVDLDVRPGEIVALLGTNGAGKSTLLAAISGLVEPVGGSIHFDGRDVTHADPGQTAALGLVQVPGGHAVFPTLTVAEHLRLAGWLQDDPDQVRAAVEEALDRFPRLRERRQQVAGDLSGGEQQMLAIAMALIGRPRLLMIDELSLGLAPIVVADLLEVVRRIAEQGTAVVIVEQSVNVALSLAERASFMEKGEVRFQGPTAELLERPDVLRSVFLQGAASGLAGAGDRQPAAVVGADPAAPDRVAAPLLQVRDVAKRYGGIMAVDRVDLHVGRGEVVGVIGPNGAGKTTLFDIVSGFVTPDVGTIELSGHDITKASPHARAWRGLGRSFQAARLVPSLSVAENLALGLERHLEVRDHLASALHLPAVVRQEEDVAWSVGDLVELLGLGAYRDKLVRDLSTGTRRIVDLGMVIGHDPDLLLLDEPSSGIAQRETEALGPLLLDIRREVGCSLLVIEHDMPLITSISDRLVAMDLGRVVAEGPPGDVIRNEHVVRSYLGGDLAVIERSGAGGGR